MSNFVSSFFAGFLTSAAAGIATIIILLIPTLIDSAKANWRKRFRQQLKLSIQRGNLSFEDLEHIAERWQQNRNSVLQSLRVLLAEALSGEDSDIDKFVTEVRDLLKSHQYAEPYAELPENISLQLTRLTEAQPESKHSVTQLASSLSDLYSTHQRELTKQKKYSFWGFVIGLIGVLLSIPGLYITLTA